MPETFGAMLLEIMQRNHISQRQLAEWTGITPSALNRILRPDYRFTPGRTIDRLTKHAGCTYDERVELYRVAGIVPPELVEKFCSSQQVARQLLEL